MNFIDTIMKKIITRMRALVYADYALKFLQTRDSTTKEEREYNQAIRTLKALAEKYGELKGIDVESIKVKVIVKNEEVH
nr:MAG: hypothetical protein [Bacteriophage sp.]